MSAPILADYWKSVEWFCGACRKALRDAFVSYIVVGSLSVGDAVPGWSDVDGFLVVRDAAEHVRVAVARLTLEAARRFPFLASDRGSRFSAIVASREEVLHGGGEVSFLDRWDIKRHGIVACGEDLPTMVDEPALDRGWLDRHLDWMTAFLAKEREAPARWVAVNSIGFVLSGARVAVLKRGMYAKCKDELAAAFTRLYPERSPILERAMQARRKWPVILERPGEIAALYEEATDFLQWVRSLP